MCVSVCVFTGDPIPRNLFGAVVSSYNFPGGGLPCARPAQLVPYTHTHTHTHLVLGLLSALLTQSRLQLRDVSASGKVLPLCLRLSRVPMARAGVPGGAGWLDRYSACMPGPRVLPLW